MTRRIPLLPTIVVTAAIAVLIGLGVWQLQRAKWKAALLARYEQAERLPPITWPTMPLKDDQLPLFRQATGVCLRPVGHRAMGGENRAGDPGYVQIVDCVTGGEGPGMSVEVGWSRNPSVRVAWPGGPVSGIIVPDKQSRIRLVAATAPQGLEPSQVPSAETASAVTPGGHRMYAATWFALALTALVIYIVAVMKREPKA
jgi:cytochrome oxidase assembly protein ShyY1